MHIKSNFLKDFTEQGFATVPDLANDTEIEALLAALEEAQEETQGETHRETGARRNQSGVYAMRNLLEIKAVHDWAKSEKVHCVLAPILGDTFFPVRGILFDKTPGANWKVGWHQDLSIAVQQRIEVAGFGPWSEKAGLLHVQPPCTVLEQMLTIRLHLDECGEANGPLRVVPGSHHDGKLATDAIIEKRHSNGQVICTCPSGGALLMRPLLLHASSPATSPAHRRVVHIEFAAHELPGGLQWIV